MKILKTKIKGLLLIENKIFKDKRGYFKEIFKNSKLNKNFIYEYLSYSKKNVLRGMHIQTINPQAKIISVHKGKILDVVLDLRKNSKSYGESFKLNISEKSDFSIYIPEGFAHGFLCLSKDCIVSYKCSQYQNLKSETSIAWNKLNNLKIWPKIKPILSKKDRAGISLENFKLRLKKNQV